MARVSALGALGVWLAPDQERALKPNSCGATSWLDLVIGVGQRLPVVACSRALTPNDFRQFVNDPIYQATFPAMRLARDTDREIVTTMRGKRYTTSIEGTLTGLGGNLVIIDDPLKQESNP